MITHNLFPTPVSYFELGEDLTQEELGFINGQEKRESDGNLITVNSYLFKSPELKRISDFCNKCVNEFTEAIYSPKNEVSVYVTQSWANFTGMNQFHHKHEHPNSFISGVFYVNAKKDVDKIIFFKNTYSQIDLVSNKYNAYNAQSWWMPVETGQLILFPSSLSHMVETVKSDDTRISIAFNTFVKGYIGADEMLGGLHL
jgi:uncharacterized protein (TIGR02466 family)